MNYEKIPDDLKTRRQWVLWKNENGTKPLYQLNGRKASHSNQKHWHTFPAVLKRHESNGTDYAGIGYVFAKSDPYLGIDLDHCRDPESGDIAEWARAVITVLDSYAEVSPSGTGVKIWTRANNPMPTGRKVAVDAPALPGQDPPAIELYDKMRFFTVTGQRLANVSPNVESRQNEVCQVVERFFGGKPPPRKPAAGPTSDVTERARKYLATMPAAVSGQGGHSQTFRVACVLVQKFGLSTAEARPLLEEYNTRCEPPWSPAELAHKLDDAEKQPGERGYLLNDDGPVATAAATEPPQDKPKTPWVTNAGSITKIVEKINAVTGGQPYRIGNVLFVDDPKHGIGFLDNVSATFGFIQQHARVVWDAKLPGKPTKTEVHELLRRTAKNYDAVEELPHFPPADNCYYASVSPPRGDGSALAELIETFRPETDVDADLIKSAIVTQFWGGPAGTRPAFVFTSDAGRGAGKTKCATLCAYVANGFIDVSANEEIAVIKQRLLSPDGCTKRVALLDNVKSHGFSWAELESLVTNPLISGKRMYTGEWSRPNTVTWFITLNGVSLATDMSQRSVIIKLVRGPNDGTWYEKMIQFVDRNRQRLIGDVRGFLEADNDYHLADYSRWAAWERDILERLPEPAEAQKVILERQGTANVDCDEAEFLIDAIADRLHGVGYDTKADQVRIPVALLTEWYNRSMNDNKKATGVSRRIRQMIHEGQVSRLLEDTSRTYGRCFIWVGEDADPQDPIQNDLPGRVEIKNQPSRYRS